MAEHLEAEFQTLIDMPFARNLRMPLAIQK
jgi:hypothetical protein